MNDCEKVQLTVQQYLVVKSGLDSEIGRYRKAIKSFEESYAKYSDENCLVSLKYYRERLEIALSVRALMDRSKYYNLFVGVDSE